MFSNVVVKMFQALVCKFSKVRHKVPEDGPDGQKHVGANMRYFNCTF